MTPVGKRRAGRGPFGTIKVCLPLLLAGLVPLSSGCVRHAGKNRATVVCYGKDDSSCSVKSGFALVRPGGKSRAVPAMAPLHKYVSDLVEAELTSKDGFKFKAALDLSYRIRLLRLVEDRADITPDSIDDLIRDLTAPALRKEAAKIQFADVLSPEASEDFKKAAEKAATEVFSSSMFRLERPPVIHLKAEPSQKEAFFKKLVRPSKVKVLLIGLDGLDWNILNPLLEKGQTPNFARIIDSGISGNLRSFEPMLSPLIWTTVVTGKMPEKHGILDFVYLDKESNKMIPVTSETRKTLALWQMFSLAGKRSSIVNWYASWPAEKIDGEIVTNMAVLGLGMDKIKAEAKTSGIAYPESLMDEIQPLILTANDIGPDVMSDMIDDSWPGAKEFLEDYDRATGHVTQLKDMLVSHVSHLRIAQKLIEEKKPDFAGIYLSLTDTVCHQFLEFAPPRRKETGDMEYAAFKGVVDQAYRMADEAVGALMEAAGDDYTVIVASDHGFKTGDNRPRESGAMEGRAAALWHRLNGVIMAAGGPIARTGEIPGANVQDLAPSLLYLMGLPVAWDMDGRPIAGLFEPEFLKKNPVRTIPTYEIFNSPKKSAPRLAKGGRTEVEEEIFRRLQGLGYIEGHADESTEADVREASNLGLRLLKAGKLDEAIDTFKKGLESTPSAGLYGNLGAAYMEKKEWAPAEKALRKASDLEPGNPNHRVNLGALFMKKNEALKAKEEFLAAIAVDPGLTEAYNNLGIISQRLRQFEESEGYFKKALSLDDANAAAHLNYGILNWERQDYKNAARELEIAFQLDRKYGQNLTLVYALGVSYYKAGRVDEALKTLLSVQAAQDNLPQLHYHLGLIYDERGDKKKAIEEFQKETDLFPTNMQASQRLRALKAR